MGEMPVAKSASNNICFIEGCQDRRDDCPGYCALAQSAMVFTRTLGAITQADEFALVNGATGIAQIEARIAEGCSQPKDVSHQLHIATQIIQGLT
jgi:hypothetical protein